MKFANRNSFNVSLAVIAPFEIVENITEFTKSAPKLKIIFSK